MAFNFQETDNNPSGKQTYPFVRIKFKSWQKIFDLTEFDKKKTDEGLFKNHQKMKNSVQLMHIADSISREGDRYYIELKSTVNEYFTLLRYKKNLQILDTPKDSILPNPDQSKATVNKNKPILQLDSISQSTLANTPYQSTPSLVVGDTQSIKKLPMNFYEYINGLKPYEKMTYLTNAESKARNVHNAADNAINQLQMIDDSSGKFVYEMHMKYNFAIICLVFLFIGAPMGAIIQKGGFGMPILVAIGFFMVYMVGNIYCKNLKGSHDLDVISAAWLPVIIMLPFAVFLTHRAMNDYKMLNFDPLKFFQKLKLPTFFKK